jgi:hypothetical protein
MRENTSRRTITTFNFGDGHYGNESASHEWTPAEVQTAFVETNVIDAYADQHEQNRYDTDYVLDLGLPQVFEYRLPGLRVVALLNDGALATVFTIEDADLSRVHTALRTGRTLSLRYVKADGEVTRRRVQPQSLRISKAGDVILRATDDRRAGDTRSFRWDRVTHTTLHREVRKAAPTKSALWAEFERTLPAVETVTVVTDVYTTTPGTAAALEAPEEIQDRLAERFALGHAYAFITV